MIHENDLSKHDSITLHELISESFKTFLDKKGQFLTLFLISSGLILLHAILHNLFFTTNILGILGPEFDLDTHSCNFALHLTELMLTLTFITTQILISLSSVKLIEKDKKIADIFQSTLSNAGPLIFTLLMSMFLIFLSYMLLTRSITFTYDFWSHEYSIIKKIGVTFAAIIIFITTLNLILRTAFSNFVAVIQQKYYIKPLIHSLAYTKNSVTFIFSKMVVILLTYLLFSMPLLLVVDNFFQYSNLSSIWQISLNAIILLIPLQISVIAFYLLYKLYPSHFTPDITLNSVQKVKLKVLLSLIFITIIILSVLKFLEYEPSNKRAKLNIQLFKEKKYEPSKNPNLHIEIMDDEEIEKQLWK